MAMRTSPLLTFGLPEKNGPGPMGNPPRRGPWPLPLLPLRDAIAIMRRLAAHGGGVIAYDNLGLLSKLNTVYHDISR